MVSLKCLTVCARASKFAWVLGIVYIPISVALMILVFLLKVEVLTEATFLFLIALVVAGIVSTILGCVIEQVMKRKIAALKRTSRVTVTAALLRPSDELTAEMRQSAEVNENTYAPMSAPMREPMSTPMREPMSAPMRELMSTPMREPMRAPMSTPMRAPMSTPMRESMSTPMRAPMSAPMHPSTSTHDAPPSYSTVMNINSPYNFSVGPVVPTQPVIDSHSPPAYNDTVHLGEQ